jgi:hypothetical protein
MLTIETDTSGYATGLQSINSAQAPTSTPEAPILSGSRLFRYGYFEARMKYNPNGYRGSERGWPGVLGRLPGAQLPAHRNRLS